MSDTSCFAVFDGMAWPKPGERVSNIQHKMRYADHKLTRDDLLIAASVLCAYGALVARDTEDRESIVAGIVKEANR